MSADPPYDDDGDPSCWTCWDCARDLLGEGDSMEERYREVYASAHRIASPGPTAPLWVVREPGDHGEPIVAICATDEDAAAVAREYVVEYPGSEPYVEAYPLDRPGTRTPSENGGDVDEPDLDPRRHRAVETVERMRAVLDLLSDGRPRSTTEIVEAVATWRTWANARGAIKHLEADGRIVPVDGSRRAMGHPIVWRLADPGPEVPPGEEAVGDEERIDATLTRADGTVETVTASVYTNEGRFGLRDFRTADDEPVVLHPGDSLNLPIVEIDGVARWEGPPP